MSAFLRVSALQQQLEKLQEILEQHSGLEESELAALIARNEELLDAVKLFKMLITNCNQGAIH